MSTVSIELVLDALAGPIEVGGGRPEGTVRQAVGALVGTLLFLGGWVDLGGGLWVAADGSAFESAAGVMGGAEVEGDERVMGCR